MQCGVGGSFLLRTGSEFGDVLAEFQIESPIITEPFAKDTRVLVESHFTTGNRGERIVAIEGIAGFVISISVVGEPSKEFSLAFHANVDGEMMYNKFRDSQIMSDLNTLSYRPDAGNPPIEGNNDPKSEQYEPAVGYSGMLGDSLGHFPGEKVTLSQFSSLDSFIYKTSEVNVAKRIGAEEEDIEEVEYTTDSGKLVIDVGRGLYGRTEVLYTYGRGILSSYPFASILKVKSGDDIVTAVDTIFLTRSDRKQLLRINHRWFDGTAIELDIPSSGFTVHSVLVVQLKNDLAKDFLTDTSSSSQSSTNLLDKVKDLPVLIESSVMSACYSDTGRIYVFFEDKDGNISCAESNDEGSSWYFHYGIVQSVDQIKAQYPFTVTNKERNVVFLFYYFNGKIMVKRIDCGELFADDALLIERFDQDIFVPPPDNSDSNARENQSIYTREGMVMRYRSVNHVAAGDLNDEEFLALTGRDLEEETFEPTEDRDVITGSIFGHTFTDTITVRKSSLAIGALTAFANNDHGDYLFSAYRRDNGEMCLFFMAPTESDQGGGSQLQCHFSVDDGIDWYDKWEYNEHGYNRFRTDSDRHTQFLDLNASGANPSSVFATDPQISDQEAPFGINVHWSRLKKHKLEGGNTLDSESQVMAIEAPYLFYLPLTKTAFLFYIYEECLLCKVFGDEIFDNSMENIKKLLEKNSRAYFVDGNLESNDLREEIHRYYDTETNEIMAEGNIVFQYQHAIDTFDDTRVIPAQRVCAHELPNGTVRILYKNEDGRLHASMWVGNMWLQEDLLNSDASKPTVTVVPNDATEVVGGFGSESFLVVNQ